MKNKDASGLLTGIEQRCQWFIATPFLIFNMFSKFIIEVTESGRLDWLTKHSFLRCIGGLFFLYHPSPPCSQVLPTFSEVMTWVSCL